MDEIFINIILFELENTDAKNCEKLLSADDNFNISNFLQLLGLHCEGRTLWEIQIENFEIRVNSSTIIYTLLEKDLYEEGVSTG